MARLVGVVQAWRYTSPTMAADAAELRVEPCAGSWALAGAGAGEVELVNDFLLELASSQVSSTGVTMATYRTGAEIKSGSFAAETPSEGELARRAAQEH